MPGLFFFFFFCLCFWARYVGYETFDKIDFFGEGADRKRSCSSEGQTSGKTRS